MQYKSLLGCVFVILALLASPTEGNKFGFLKRVFRRLVGKHSNDVNSPITEFSLEKFGDAEAKTGTGCVLKNLQYLGNKLIEASTHLVKTKDAQKEDLEKQARKGLCTLLHKIKTEAQNKNRVARPVMRPEETPGKLTGISWEAVWENASFAPQGGKDPEKAWAQSLIKNNCNLKATGDYFPSLDPGHFMKNVLKPLFPELKEANDYWEDPFRKEFSLYKKKLFFAGYRNSQHQRVAKSQKLAEEVQAILDNIKTRKTPDALSEKDGVGRKSMGGSIDMDSVVQSLQKKVTTNQREWATFYTDSVFDSIELQNRLLGLFREMFEPLDTFKISSGKMTTWGTMYKWLREMQLNIEESALEELQRFELNFNNPQKCLLAVNEEAYCIKPTRWDFWLDFTVGLRDALLNLNIENENPCKFTIDIENRSMLGPIIHQITHVCLETYLQHCPDGKIRSGRTYNCVVRSNTDAKRMLDAFVTDELVTKADLDNMLNRDGTQVGKQNSKANLKANKNIARRRLLAKRTSVAIKISSALKRFQADGYNAVVETKADSSVRFEKIEEALKKDTDCKVTIKEMPNYFNPFKSEELICYYSEHTLTTLFELTDEFFRAAEKSKVDEWTLVTNFQASLEGESYEYKIYSQEGVGVRWESDKKDQRRRRLLSGRNGKS